MAMALNRPRLRRGRALRTTSLQQRSSGGNQREAVSDRGPIRGWIHRQRDELVRDGLIGIVVLVIGTGAVICWNGRIAERQEIQENTRFVRQVVIDNATEKPFAGLNLHDAVLAGLDLACDDLSTQTCSTRSCSARTCAWRTCPART